jgi:hypothetical protein
LGECLDGGAGDPKPSDGSVTAAAVVEMNRIEPDRRGIMCRAAAVAMRNWLVG